MAEHTMKNAGFDPSRCALCGSTDATVILHLPTGRSMRSDQAVLARDLRKLECRRCGLVRDGHAYAVDDLHAMYRTEYATAPAEYTFYTADGPITRSALVCEWLCTAFGSHRWRTARRWLEVGAGAGALLAEFAKRLPEAQFEGVELSQSEAAEARRRGLNVHHADVDDLVEHAFDVVYTVAVLEHVPSPTAYLRSLRRRLRAGGLLLLCQPTQDVPSYDVFFADHLHHFGTAHVRGFAAACGFREIGFVVGQEWMPNFSAHLWLAVDLPTAGVPGWYGPPGFTTCAATAKRVAADMERLNETLATLHRAHRRVAAFGLNEVYALATAYSALGSTKVTCGLADRTDDPAYSRFGFPVLVPERCRELGVQDVLLTLNAVYYPQVTRRLAPLGVAVHPVLT